MCKHSIQLIYLSSGSLSDEACKADEIYDEWTQQCVPEWLGKVEEEIMSGGPAVDIVNEVATNLNSTINGGTIANLANLLTHLLELRENNFLFEPQRYHTLCLASISLLGRHKEAPLCEESCPPFLSRVPLFSRVPPSSVVSPLPPEKV